METSLHSEVSKYQLKALKFKYENNNNLIIAEGEAHAFDQFGKEIFSDIIIYDKSKSVILTKRNSIYKDKRGNVITADNFYYDIELSKIIAKKNVKYKDKLGNLIKFSNFEYLEKEEKGFGLNAIAELKDKSLVEGNIAEIDNRRGQLILKNKKNKDNFFKEFLSIFKKNNNTYTPCEIIEKSQKGIYENCPDWSVTTIKTRHDRINKMIYHDHAVIKIKNFPVFYTPYFSHPDPTVKRKSGFLNPSIKNFSTLGRTFKTPYFWAINENSDLTFTPIIYQDENSIYLSEYRNQNKNSLMYVDTSYSEGYKNLNKKNNDGQSLNRSGGSRNHLFIKFFGNYENLILDSSELELNMQRVSQKNYLSVNQINTNNLKQDITALNNNIILNSYSENQKIKIAANIYEDLSNDNPNAKYQYIIPSIENSLFLKKFNSNINILNSFDSKNYSGDTKQSIQINKILLSSEDQIIKKYGISNKLKSNIYNINTYNDKVDGAKENFNSDVIPMIGIESSIPFVKYEKNNEQTIIPKIFSKYASGTMSNSNSENKILRYSDVYEMDRMNSTSNPERGASIGYGLEYDSNKKNNTSEIYKQTKISIGQVINEKKSIKKPSNSSLNDKSSNFVGDFSFMFKNDLYNNNINSIKSKSNINSKDHQIYLNYSYNLSNDLNKILRNDVQIKYNGFNSSASVNYYETHDIDNQQYIEASFQKQFDYNLNFLIKARKNLELEYSETNSIELNYESDCLKVGVSLSKNFYQNDDIQTSNNLNLFVMLKPFGQPVAPDLSSFVGN